MITEPIFCGTYSCATEEQCDDCFLIDHQKQCAWCTEYDHDERKLEVQHDTGERKFKAELAGWDAWESLEARMELQAEAEVEHGEERVSAND